MGGSVLPLRPNIAPFWIRCLPTTDRRQSSHHLTPIDTFTDTVIHAQMESVTADGKHVEHKLVLYFAKAKTPYLVSAKADVNTLKSRYGVTTFGDLVDLRLTIEIVNDRRHGELLRIKPTPPPTPAPATDSESEVKTTDESGS